MFDFDEFSKHIVYSSLLSYIIQIELYQYPECSIPGYFDQYQPYRANRLANTYLHKPKQTLF